LNSVLPQDRVAEIRAALAPHLARELKGRNDFEGVKTNGVYALLAKSPMFAGLVPYPLAMAFVEAEPDESCLLSALLTINLQPGETVQQPWHFDDSDAKIPRPRPPLGVSTFCAIDDTAKLNGATEIIPGSLAITKGTLWHRGGAHRSDHPRLIVTPQYGVGWVRQLENMCLAAPPEIVDKLPERVRELIGCSIHPPFMGTSTACTRSACCGPCRRSAPTRSNDMPGPRAKLPDPRRPLGRLILTATSGPERACAVRL
jgi:Phytanoyl-CoA dioxygenase (PhyH)